LDSRDAFLTPHHHHQPATPRRVPPPQAIAGARPWGINPQLKEWVSKMFDEEGVKPKGAAAGEEAKKEEASGGSGPEPEVAEPQPAAAAAACVAL